MFLLLYHRAEQAAHVAGILVPAGLCISWVISSRKECNMTYPVQIKLSWFIPLQKICPVRLPPSSLTSEYWVFFTDVDVDPCVYCVTFVGPAVHPSNASRWANVVLMLVHRQRRWINNKPTLAQRLAFADSRVVQVRPGLWNHSFDTD